MTRVDQLTGSLCQAAPLLLGCFVQLAAADRMAHRGSLIVDGAQLVEDLLSAPGPSFVKATALTIAALVGGAGLAEACARGTGPATADLGALALKATEALANDGDSEPEEQGESEEGGPAELKPGMEEDEDLLHGEYEGFMDGLYEGSFEGLSEADLVTRDAPFAPKAEALAPSAAASGEHEKVGTHPSTGAPEVELAAPRSGSKEVDGGSPEEGGQPPRAGAEGQAEEQLEAQLSQDTSELLSLGGDYADVMEQAYRGLFTELVEAEAVLHSKT